MAEARYGNARSAVDDNRVRVPAKYRSVLGESFNLLPGKGGCLLLISEEHQQEVIGAYLKNYDPYTTSDFEDDIRRYMVDVELDEQGRFSLSTTMKAMCEGLDSAVEIVFTGGGLYVELWPAKVYDKKFGKFDAAQFNSLIANLKSSLSKSND